MAYIDTESADVALEPETAAERSGARSDRTESELSPTDMASMATWRSKTFSVLEPGALSSSASSSSSLPSGQLALTVPIGQIADTRRFVEDRTYKLLIVDSIMNLFRKLSAPPTRATADEAGQDYSGRGELSERQQVGFSYLKRVAAS